jgi:hypothetical protein
VTIPPALLLNDAASLHSLRNGTQLLTALRLQLGLGKAAQAQCRATVLLHHLC